MFQGSGGQKRSRRRTAKPQRSRRGFKPDEEQGDEAQTDKADNEGRNRTNNGGIDCLIEADQVTGGRARARFRGLRDGVRNPDDVVGCGDVGKERENDGGDADELKRSRESASPGSIAAESTNRAAQREESQKQPSAVQRYFEMHLLTNYHEMQPSPQRRKLESWAVLVLSCCNLMARALLLILAVCCVTVGAHAADPEPLIGTWTLSGQTIDGRTVESEPITLRIYPAKASMAGELEFAYSMPVNGIHLVSLRFVSVHLDGRESSVQDVRGHQIGTVKIAKVSPLEYTEIVEGPNRPKAVGKLLLSADKKQLTSASDTPRAGSGTTHAVQVFVRH